MRRLWSVMLLVGLAFALILCGCVTHPAKRSKSVAYEFESGNYQSPYHGVIYNGYGGGWYR
jgi:hypothetical protein